MNSYPDEILAHAFPAGTDPQAIAGMVHQFFTGEKYKLELGETSNGFYGYGNDTLRILFGAFVKRFRFQTKIETAATGEIILRISKGMSGAMGGAIGYSQMNKETVRITAALKKHFGLA